MALAIPTDRIWSRLLAGGLTWDVAPLVMRILRVRWNRHAPNADQTRPHRHPFHQILYYSSGNGVQRLGALAAPVGPGALCFIRAGLLHSFRGAGRPAATCLALDFELGAAGERVAATSPAAELS